MECSKGRLEIKAGLVVMNFILALRMLYVQRLRVTE